MSKIHKPGNMHWIVKIFNINKQCIEDYDVLKYREEQIKKFKKLCDSKEEFAEKLRREFQWQFWSRSEYELVIIKEDDGNIWLVPWVGCRNEDEAKINVTNDDALDWVGFADEHISKQIYGNKAKIDIFDMLTYKDQFNKLVNYCWYTRQKYQRDHPKFHQ